MCLDDLYWKKPPRLTDIQLLQALDYQEVVIIVLSGCLLCPLLAQFFATLDVFVQILLATK